MNIPSVPPIEGYSDMVDLLVNTPKLQERLKTLKEMEDYVNTRIGDYEKYQELKGREAEITANLKQSEQLQVDAMKHADSVREEAAQDAQKIREAAKIQADQVAFEKRELERIHHELDLKAAELAEREKALLAREEKAKAAIENANKTTAAANELKALFEDKTSQISDLMKAIGS